MFVSIGQPALTCVRGPVLSAVLILAWSPAPPGGFPSWSEIRRGGRIGERHGFGDTKEVEGVDLRVERGEIFGLLGHGNDDDDPAGDHVVASQARHGRVYGLGFVKLHVPCTHKNVDRGKVLCMICRTVVTYDLFSALTDSRRGGSAQFAQLAAQHDWAVAGEDVYDRWDAHNKSAQRDCTQWRSYRELAGEALAATYSELELAGNPATDIEVLLGSVGTWPLWPDVETNVTALSQRYRLGLLSNVDDDIAALTRALPLVSPKLVFTSQRLRAYKPGRRIYTEATRLTGSLVHVATSGRDVAGALRAGVRVIRLRRPGLS